MHSPRGDRHFFASEQSFLCLHETIGAPKNVAGSTGGASVVTSASLSILPFQRQTLLFLPDFFDFIVLHFIPAVLCSPTSLAQSLEVLHGYESLQTPSFCLYFLEPLSQYFICLGGFTSYLVIRPLHSFFDLHRTRGGASHPGIVDLVVVVSHPGAVGVVVVVSHPGVGCVVVVSHPGVGWVVVVSHPGEVGVVVVVSHPGVVGVVVVSHPDEVVVVVVVSHPGVVLVVVGGVVGVSQEGFGVSPVVEVVIVGVGVSSVVVRSHPGVVVIFSLVTGGTVKGTQVGRAGPPSEKRYLHHFYGTRNFYQYTLS